MSSSILRSHHSLIALVVITLLAALVSSSIAKPHHGHGGKHTGAKPDIAAHDRNGDGQLDDAERSAMYAARADAVLRELDANKDGAISRTEGDAGKAPMLAKRFDEIDADRNARVDRKELVAAIANAAAAKAAKHKSK